jgi:hypothetical protein
MLAAIASADQMTTMETSGPDCTAGRSRFKDAMLLALDEHVRAESI